MTLEGSATFEHGGAQLHLLPQRAVWWPAQRTLIAADVHLGKGTAFRALGVPVPSGSSAKDLGRLASLVQVTAAERLIVLGDLIHGRRSHQPELTSALADWRTAHVALDVVLVRGNHDHSAGRLPQALNITEVDAPYAQSGLLLQHHPTATLANGAVLAGHVHPVVVLRDFDRSRLMLPCFVFNRDGVGILPSFGSFTGGAQIERAEGQHVFACAAARVVRMQR
jgi:DNA ligase-associated metallophosphoesterase